MFLYTCNLFVPVDKYYGLRKWSVISINESSELFSACGDFGSYIADAYNCVQVGGILTGSTDVTPSTSVTYITPILFILNVLHDTRLFKTRNAHLNPALA